MPLIRTFSHARSGARYLLGASLLALVACGDADESVMADSNPVTPPQTKLSEVAEREATEREAARLAGQRREGPQTFIKTDPGEGFLTPEILSTVALSGTPLRNVAISPDGARITYLQGSEADPNQLDLWAYDAETGEASVLVRSTDLLGEPEVLSEEEKNRRERAREYGRGIIAYSWVDADTLLFPLGGDVYLYDLRTAKARQVTATEGYESDIRLSGDGAFVTYVRDDELFVTDLATGLERQITRGSTETVRNAVASFVVQEELGRSTGYWPGPNAERVAYTQIDESPIAVESRVDMGADGLSTVEQRYPFAGTDNARVRLGITSMTARGRTVWADVPGWADGDDIYLTRVAWAPDGDALYAGILSRDHKTHTIYRVNADTGAAEIFHEETSPTWLNIRSGLTPTDDGFEMVSERDGIRRLYSITADGAKALTPEGLLVNSVLCTADDGTRYVRGWREDPLQSHIFRITPVVKAEAPDIDTDGAVATPPAATPPAATPAFAVQRLSDLDGMWSARFADDCSRYVGYYSSPDQPPQSAVYSNAGERAFWLSENALDADHPYAPYLSTHITPEYGTLKAADGSDLHYQIYKPTDLRAGERRPSITIVYGGPGVQRVNKGWGRRELSRMLAHHGFVVFAIDGRGSTNRGKAFEDPLYRGMAKVEVEDQRAGAEWLKSQDYIDPDRMGVYGWSYGGYMVLHMLGQTDLYAAGVSGAPVTDWSLYDTAYTERYLGDPRPDNANYTEGSYENANVLAHLDGLTEPVLVIHGMADDNVVFRHTVMLADAMIAAGRHNLVLKAVPGEKHGFRSEAARVHRDRSILEFFADHLGRDESGS